ncbi:GNAT family N-acetyltransferase [Hamadaea tsunoensis]|uniref:GNAT family N-acetyltransferase n=1 Tax=Hamadaea tsunoensis TaxID=53368 RepID=UPI0004832989|nr:GNAT family N-acetyltransferase [Hamadaea tsunoensis]
MITPTLHSRGELLERTAGHPHAQLTSSDDDCVGYERDGALVWLSHGNATSVGERHAILSLLVDLAADGVLDGRRWLDLPRTGADVIARYFTVRAQDDWDLLFATEPPAPMAGEDRVIRLTAADEAEILAVQTAALPHTTSRPGDPRIRAWYGIRSEGRLVAVAGDRSPGNGVGFLAAIAVHPDAQGNGLGGCLTAALTRLLLQEYATVALGVMSDNTGARRLYERLGFTGSAARTSVSPG